MITLFKNKFYFFIFLYMFFSLGCENSSFKTSQQSPKDQNQNNTPADSGTVADFKLTCVEAQFVRLINLYRASHQKNILAVSKAGVLSSRWHANDMIVKNYFSHTEPDGRDFSSRASSFGYSAWAENIAAGSSTAEGVFCQWKLSPGHNTNMLADNHMTMGIGCVSGSSTYGIYWSNNFGPSSEDTLMEPLTVDSPCVLPVSVPGC